MPLRRITNLKRRPNRINWSYKPSPQQLKFHQASEKFRLYGGAMGGGKTWALCAEALKLSIKYPGNRIYLCRHEMQEFKRTTQVTFELVCPHGLMRRHIRAEFYYELRNGSQIVYGGLGGQEDRDKIKGLELGAFLIDEATETSEEMFKLLCTRLRWTLPNGTKPNYYGLLASNPEPGWVKNRFITAKKPNHIFIPALPSDNPFLPEDYVSELRIDWEHVSPEWIKRYLEGSWDAFEGQIYHEFDRTKHVYRDIEISEWWDTFRVIDYGYTNPTCCLWIAVDGEGRLIVYDEYYERRRTIEENAYIIKMKYPAFDGITLFDPSMFSISSTRDSKPWSYAQEYGEQGIIGIKPYTKDGHMGESMAIQLVKQRLKANSLLIHESCTNTLEEIVKYRWRDLKPTAQINANLPEQPIDKDNHAMDCLRYACMWRPLSSSPSEQPIDPRSVHYAIMKHKRQLRRDHYAGWYESN